MTQQQTGRLWPVWECVEVAVVRGGRRDGSGGSGTGDGLQSR